VIETPCIKVCVLDPASGLCQGCGRSLDEIARWGTMSGEERRRIMEELEGRREKARRAPLLPASERRRTWKRCVVNKMVGDIRRQ
jgi:hypothetical protein